MNGHAHRELISPSGCSDNGCPLTLVADWKPLEKLSQLDTARNLSQLPLPGTNGLLVCKKDLRLSSFLLTQNKAGPTFLDRGESIVPGDLRQAFSRGVLHAKIYA